MGKLLGKTDGEDQEKIFSSNIESNEADEAAAIRDAKQQKLKKELELEQIEETRGESREREQEEREAKPKQVKNRDEDEKTQARNPPAKVERKLSRYFDDTSDKKCYNCNAKGHLSKDCPRKKRVFGEEN